MKIGILCDLHLPTVRSASQYAVLDWAIDTLEKEGVDLVVTAGDTTAAGAYRPLQDYLNRMSRFPHLFLLGNSDIRDEFDRERIITQYAKSSVRTLCGHEIVGISTPYTHLTSEDRALLEQCSDGAIVLMHHNPNSLIEESRNYLNDLLSRKALTLIHGHKHMEMMQQIGDSRVFGLRGLDPDKVLGLPAISFFEFTDSGVSFCQREFRFPVDQLDDFWDYIGISCFHPETDIDYAISRGIKKIELQLRKPCEPEQLSLLEDGVTRWRATGGDYLSVHLPDLRLIDGIITGAKEWYEAVALAEKLGADGVTVHIPRASYADMITDGPIWRSFLHILTEGIERLPSSTNVGIECLHAAPGMKNTPDRMLGLVPEECISWTNAINRAFGYDRVGFLLDVGHASNNGPFVTRYIRSVWYELLGKRAVGYHIHQVSKENGGLTNHNAIDPWFGMMISYASFFWAWQNGHLNHAPMFLEMKNVQNCEISLRSLTEICKVLNITTREDLT